MRTQKVVSDTQFGILVAYMEKNKDFAMFRLRSSSALEKRNYGEQWEKLAITLNSVGATNKTPAKWKDYWNEKKYSVRKKAFELKTKGGKLTRLEERVLTICGQMTVAKVRMLAQVVNGKATSLRPKAANTLRKPTPACSTASTDSLLMLSPLQAQTVDVTTSPVSLNHPLSWSSSSSEHIEPYFRKCPCEYCLPEPTTPPTAESHPQATKRPSPMTPEPPQSGIALTPKVVVADSSKRASATNSPASPSAPPPQPAHHTPVVDSRTLPPVPEQSQNTQDSAMRELHDFDERLIHLKRESVRALRDIVDELTRGHNAIIDCFNSISVIQTRHMASTTRSLARIEMVLESTLRHHYGIVVNE